ncbi:hypothetical protein MKZ38_004833 [Zalerion maritima]|uniref:Uncharacterized protein n=1 Tax=Zalerion maritima TaxID=339359 RepID=A0AAD5WPB5_9PEZI|nr:hypothetical protein MKZ38_004833 [Zalerion maritima]
MSQFYDSTLNIPNSIRGNETVGAGISSWVHRLDAVAKCYSNINDKDKEIAVFERLGSDSIQWRAGLRGQVRHVRQGDASPLSEQMLLLCLLGLLALDGGVRGLSPLMIFQQLINPD